MKGYSKIKLMNSNKSRSMDFSDQTTTTPRFQKPISTKKPTIKTTQEQPKIQDEDDDYKHYSNNHHHQEEDGNFPMKMLNRNHSVSSAGTTIDSKGTSALSSRFKIEKQHSTGRTLQTSVKRVFSIRRSSSVSESYSRIHDQYAKPFDVDDYQEQEEDLQMARSKNKQTRGSILKACKRIFGL